MDKNEVWRRQDEFRALAQNSAERARTLLAGDDDRSVTYAALELRFGLEALIYAHAINYLDELGDPKRLDWQAPKLLEQLIDIDPFADSTMFLRAVDPITGERHNVGIERRLDLKKLKKRYYKLGNALHAPSIASMDIKNHKNKTEWRSRKNVIVLSEHSHWHRRLFPRSVKNIRTHLPFIVNSNMIYTPLFKAVEQLEEKERALVEREKQCSLLVEQASDLKRRR